MMIFELLEVKTINGEIKEDFIDTNEIVYGFSKTFDGVWIVGTFDINKRIDNKTYTCYKYFLTLKTKRNDFRKIINDIIALYLNGIEPEQIKDLIAL